MGPGPSKAKPSYPLPHNAMRSIILPLILLSAVLAFAGYDVVNIQPGESRPIFPGVCKAVQLNASNVLPASGTISIGEITARWETDATNDWIAVVRNSEGEISATDTYQWSDEGGWYWDQEDPSGAPDIYFWRGSWNFGGTQYEAGEDVLSVVFEDSPPGYSTEYFRESLSHKVPHATTNAMWTVTAAGGNATNNLPDKTFLETPANDWVRYGTATSGAVKLYVEY